MIHIVTSHHQSSINPIRILTLVFNVDFNLAFRMPPKASAEKKPATKAPAQKAPVEKKDAAGKKTAATGDKKKRTKTRKETYSSYIYKGMEFTLDNILQVKFDISP